MDRVWISLADGIPKVVGSIGGIMDLRDAEPSLPEDSCDLVEIRLDLLTKEGEVPDATLWNHLSRHPILFTARRIEEGGALPLDAATRAKMLDSVLAQAACIDVEVASIGEMNPLLAKAAESGIPWIASFHDFEKLPDETTLREAANRAQDAGAAVFKAAARVHHPRDLATLAEFQLTDHGIPVATMGMGLLAPVSRLLCAQCGSVLNYGYLGKTPTAPGQWAAGSLKAAIAGLEPFRL